MTEENQLTYGQKACGVTFNPSGSDDVAMCKTDFSIIIDKLHNVLTTSDNPEVKRMMSIAITEAQTAQMWAVKALTWQY